MPIVRDREDDRSTRFWTWIFLGVIAAFPILALFTLYMAFDPNDYKAEIVERVRKATGRELTLGGKIHLKLALRPTVEVADVSLSNMAGGSRPAMVTVARVQATLGLFALLQKRIEIDHLILERPDILLEMDAQGHGNWRMAPPAPTTQSAGPRTSGPAGGYAITVRELRLTDGTLTVRNRGGHMLILPLKRLDMDAEAASAPMGVLLASQWNGVDVGLSGQIGSFAGLQGLSSAAWPLRLALTASGARLNITGSIALPAQGKGYQIKLDGTAPDLAALGTLLGGTALPALRSVAFSMQLADRGDGPLEITDVSLSAGSSDLGASLGHLKLDRLDISAPKLAEAMKIDAQATLGALPIVLGASVGTPLAMLVMLGGGRPAAPLPVEVNITAAGAAVSARGRIADPARLAGIDLAVAASVPDSQTLAPAFASGAALPALRDLRFQARLATGAGGPAQGVSLREISLAQPHATISGEASLRMAPRPSIQANLHARRLDLDALRVAFGADGPAAPPQARQQGRGERAGGGRVIPDTELPFSVLREADADIQFRADELIGAGVSTRNLATHLVLRGGQLRLDPFSADLPAGKITASLSVDATKPAPAVALLLRAPGLALKQLYGDPGPEAETTGLLEVDLDLRGAGLTPRAILAGADGHLGLAIVGGAIDNRILNLGVIGDLLRAMNLGEALGRGGASQLRCFALRAEARAGTADIRALLLEASTLFLEGGGRINLADESLSLRMKVQPRLGNMSVLLPIRVGGSLGAPRVALDPTGLLGAIGQPGPGQSLGGQAGTGATGTTAEPAPQDGCASQLAIARFGRAGVLPPVAPPPHPPRGGRGRNPQQR